MRKLAILIIPVVLIIAACSTQPEPGNNQQSYQPTTAQLPSPQPPAETPQPTNTTNAQATPAFALPLGNFIIYMDQNIQEVIDTMGEPLGVFEAPSCAFDGIDRIFSFPGLQIHTYPQDGDDFIHTVSVRDDSILTQNGIYLGNSWDSVLSAYGNDYQHAYGMFTFTKGVTTLSIFVEDDMVVAITYGLIMN